MNWQTSRTVISKTDLFTPREDKFCEYLHYTPKNISIWLRSRGERNTDFVRFVQILPIFAVKRPDYQPQLFSEGIGQFTPVFVNFCRKSLIKCVKSFKNQFLEFRTAFSLYFYQKMWSMTLARTSQNALRGAWKLTQADETWRNV